MKTINRNLMILLALQLAVVGFTWTSRNVTVIESQNLFNFSADDVAEISISRMPGELKTDDGDSLRIARKGDGAMAADADQLSFHGLARQCGAAKADKGGSGATKG